MSETFSTAKRALAETAMLVHLQCNAPTALTVDASDTVIGVVLEQQINGTWCPIAFFNRQLRPPEKSTALLIGSFSVYLGMRNFRLLLEGRSFTVFTDHKPLTLLCLK